MEPKHTAVGPGPRLVRRCAAFLRPLLKGTLLPLTPRSPVSTTLCNALFVEPFLRPNCACVVAGNWPKYLLCTYLVHNFSNLGSTPFVESLYLPTVPALFR